MNKADNFLKPFITTDSTVFHDVTLNNNYVNAFHVLVLTYHKLPFPPTLWEKPNGVKTASPATVFLTEKPVRLI